MERTKAQIKVQFNRKRLADARMKLTIASLEFKRAKAAFEYLLAAAAAEKYAKQNEEAARYFALAYKSEKKAV